MRKLVLGLVVLLLLAVLGVELVAPRLAADAIEEHVRERTDGLVGVSAEVGTFPVVARLLATRKVSRLDVSLDEVAGQQLSFAEVRFALEGVTLDRDALLGGAVRVHDVDGGRVTAVIDVNAIAEALGVPVRLEGDTLVAEVAGSRIEVPLALEGRGLRLPAGLPPLALPELVPCAPTETEVREDRIELSCEVTGVPVILE